MDTPQASIDSSPLNVDGAAQAFSALLDPPDVQEKSADDLEKEVLEDLTAQKAEESSEVVEDAPAEDAVTIEVDGKAVTLTKAELADYYKNGLRQSDYTKKTMEVAETRKAAEAEIAKAQAERQEYAVNLQKMAVQLEGALQEQQKIDWNSLLESDPVEYLKQQHLYQQRQAAYQQNIQQQQLIQQQFQAESAKQLQSLIQSQQQELLAKLPDWKDPAKAQAEKAALSKYLIEQGFDEQAVGNITDHKAVILGRKAMLYDAMMAKANAAAKKVSAAPQRVVRSGVGESPRIDGRSAAMQRLGKSGRVEDAAAVFAQFL